MKRGGGEESQSASIPPCTVRAASAPGRTVGGWTPHWDRCVAFSATGATRGMGNGEGIRTTAIIATGWRSNDKFKNLIYFGCPVLSSPPTRSVVWFWLLHGGNSMEESLCRMPTKMALVSEHHCSPGFH